ncbi:MAG: OmpA family protein, partial [Alphaproteobacteria bacterium]
GHTDAKGSDSYNLALSRKRAKSVSDYLKRALPGLAATITWEGRGEREPVADNASEQGRQKNRRVEIIVNR